MVKCWLMMLSALVIHAWTASVSERAGNIKTIIDQQQALRARKYIASAKQHFAQYTKVLHGEIEGDLFLHCWAATQQIYAAIEFNDFGDQAIVLSALQMAIQLLDSPEGAVIQDYDILDWAVRAATALPKSRPQVAKLMRSASTSENLSSKSAAKFSQLSELLRTGGAKVAKVAKPLRPQQDWSVPNPAAPRCEADDQSDCRQHTKMVLHSHPLFPTVVSTVQGAVPVAMRKALSAKAIKKFKTFASRGGSPEEANNRFFGWQPKSQDEVMPRAAEWPALYQSAEYAKLRQVAKEACIQHAIQTGNYEDRAELEPLSLVLWAAVYLNGTRHSTHVHEQSVCSGVFYSQVADEAPTPIEFSDPRGLSAMGIDTTQPEAEPIAPFHRRVHFAPRSGDMVLFPSYLPHRISQHNAPAKGERVAWAFNLEGSVDTWARMVTPVPKDSNNN